MYCHSRWSVSGVRHCDFVTPRDKNLMISENAVCCAVLTAAMFGAIAAPPVIPLAWRSCNRSADWEGMTSPVSVRMMGEGCS